MSATIADQVRILLRERIPFDLHAYKHLTFGRDLVKSLLDAYDVVVGERDALSQEVSRLQERLDCETTSARFAVLNKEVGDLRAENASLRESCESMGIRMAGLRPFAGTAHEDFSPALEKTLLLVSREGLPVVEAVSRMAGFVNELSALRQEVADLCAENASLTERLKAAQSTALAIFSQELVRLREMEARVKDGRLTEDEFQAICHNLSPDDEERFIEGCYATWQKLFKRVEVRRVATVLGIRPEDLRVESCSSGPKGGELGSVPGR